MWTESSGRNLKLTRSSRKHLSWYIIWKSVDEPLKPMESVRGELVSCGDGQVCDPRVLTHDVTAAICGRNVYPSVARWMCRSARPCGCRKSHPMLWVPIILPQEGAVPRLFAPPNVWTGISRSHRSTVRDLGSEKIARHKEALVPPSNRCNGERGPLALCHDASCPYGAPITPRCGR